MTRARNWGTAAAVVLLTFLALEAAASGDLSTPPWDLRRLDGPRTAMVLPLVPSHANSSRNRMAERSSHWRRQLRNATSEARMRLYDDLLVNGYYTTRLRIGTPPQEFALIVDSGSTVTYVPCSTCKHCGKHQDPRFQPDLSSTYEPVKCTIDCSSCDREKNQCLYDRQYAEMSSSSGVLGEDIISFGKESALQPQRAVFGCENTETGDIFTQHADGIMGLGRGQLSIMDQLVDKGAISDSFSLCYGGMDVGGGAMVLGGFSPPPGMVFSHSDPVRSPYYNIDLKEIHVSGKPLQLKPSIFDGKYGTILDSGTTYAYLPEAAFVAFQDAIMEGLHSPKQIPGPDPNFKDICFSGAGSEVSELSKTFPEVDMVFNNGQKISLSPENYLFRHSKVHGAYCLGFFQNGRDPTTLLGGIIVRNTLVTYDRKNDRIGFWKTNCSDLWERLHSQGVPSPARSDPQGQKGQNSTRGLSPTPPPTESHDHVLTGQYQVGVITFDMYLNINYSNLVQNVTELTEFIAHEFEVNVSQWIQLRMMSFKSERNGSLVKWAIFPAETVGFISNSTATAIISSLTEHRIHLPDKFGSYVLVELKVELLSKRTWWQRHALVVILGVLAVIVFSSSTFLVWYLYRQKHGSVSYRLVDAPVPEQELQPL